MLWLKNNVSHLTLRTMYTQLRQKCADTECKHIMHINRDRWLPFLLFINFVQIVAIYLVQCVFDKNKWFINKVLKILQI